ncbi:recombinase family protein [Bacteroides thetaiotaomicron]|uniref:recombinase family protein n=1 Tax=Bacteroides thetaiotaomicron TaxID=818 RepID=UPI001B8B97CA|nr:recombinase family protein [Bacteroides thetaiotaomicron]QUT73011.1 Resolvase, N terminal domain [Bacteroides thetaiotaomicron]
MKAAFLIRCSTKNQDLSRQTRDLARLAKSMGYEYDLDNLVYGEKITGKDDVTKKNRDSIDRLLKAAKEQRFDVVLVAEVSRMSRDPASGRVYVRLLINMGIPVYFKDIDTWTIDPETGKKIRDAETVIGGAFDAAWKYLKSMKTQIASARRNQLDNNCISVGKPYIGYKWLGGKDKTTKTQWIVDEIAAEAVIATFNEYLKEGATLKSTALVINALYGEKVKTKFTVSRMEQILSYDTYYTGIKKINLTDPDTEEIEVFDVKVPILITKELFEAAAVKRSTNRVKGEPYPKQTVHLLSKLIKCSYCGYSMTPRAKGSDKTQDGRGANGAYRIINGKKAMSWLCMSGINNATICPNRTSIANEKLEPIIWELVKKELIAFANLNNDERLQKVEELESKIEYQNLNIQNYEKEIQKLRKRLSTAYQFSLNAAEMAGDDEDIKAMTMEEFNKTAKVIRKEITTFENSIEQAKADIYKLTNLKTFYSQPTLPKDVIEKAEANPTEQRNLVKELIEKIIPYKITTFRKKQRESGRKACNQWITVKNGAVLLEIYTINGIYYIFYNANGREATRYAYYMSGVFARYQNSIKKFEAYEEGEYFVISNANMVMETEEIDELVTVNEFVKIAKANEWVLEYPYKPES